MTSKDNLNPEPAQLDNVSGEYPETIIWNNPYVTCPDCKGSGMEMGFYEASSCSECRGDTTVRARDGRGRFITHPEVLVYVGDGAYSLPEALSNGNGTVSAESTDALSDLTNKEN